MFATKCCNTAIYDNAENIETLDNPEVELEVPVEDEEKVTLHQLNTQLKKNQNVFYGEAIQDSEQTKE